MTSNDNDDNTAAITDFFTPAEIKQIADDVDLFIYGYSSDKRGRVDEIKAQGAAHLVALFAVLVGEKQGVPIPWQMKFLKLALENRA